MDTPTGASNAITGLFYAVFCCLVCANPCSLYPPPAALAGVARHAPRASGSLLLYKTRKTSAQAEVFLVWQGQKGSKLLRNPSCGARKNLRAAAFPRFFRPLRQPLLAVSATGGASRRCPTRSACLGFSFAL